MKKRILSLVLCAAMLLSMCLFMGAGVAQDTAADTVDTTETAAAAETADIVSFTNAGPLVKPEQTAGPARVRALAANDNSGVQLSKTVSDNDDGTYTVRLEAYATGAQTTVVSTKPCDIVLVLDVSGSMDWCIEGGKNCKGHYIAATGIDTSKTYYVIDKGQYYEVVYCNGDTFRDSHDPGWYYKEYPHTNGNRLTPKSEANPGGAQFYVKEACTSRLSALKTAVGNFIDQVAAKETDTVKHNISIVKFASGKNNNVGNDTDGKGYNYSQIVKNLTDAKDGQSTLKSAVNALTAAGATRADYGMQHAQSILSNRPADRKDATKVVVMFTDGEPTSGNQFETSVANGAISAAKTLKDSGATVYTVGCMSGANGTPVNDINTADEVNKYMHLVSSNYKNATSMTNTGTSSYPAGGKSYYLSASNATELNNVFENISSQIGGSSTELTSTAVLQDAVTPYFAIPDGAAAITLKAANCTGADSNGTLTFGAETAAPGSAAATVSGNTVSVTGFDYSANWCGPRTDAAGNTTYSGQKLIVEFKIRPTDAFLGGNGVQTNVGTGDGIYAPDETTPVETFQPQSVDVTVKAVEPEATGIEIYLGEETNLADRITTNIPQLDGTNNAYVDVTYTVKDENGTVVGTYTVPAGSREGAWAWANGSNVQPDKTTTYTVTSTSTPKTGDETNTASVEKQFTITVKTCSLKITKTVTGGGDPNQTFVFNVMKGNDLVTTVVLKAGQSTTITGLSVGDYTVVEDTAWSWSYTAENDGKAAVTLSSTTPTGEAEITNTYVKHDWLTSIVDVINKWMTKDGKTIIDNSGRVPGTN